jgi:hypothetical protein
MSDDRQKIAKVSPTLAEQERALMRVAARQRQRPAPVPSFEQARMSNGAPNPTVTIKDGVADVVMPPITDPRLKHLLNR